jgi:hypothetical protein
MFSCFVFHSAHFFVFAAIDQCSYKTKSMYISKKTYIYEGDKRIIKANVSKEIEFRVLFNNFYSKNFNLKDKKKISDPGLVNKNLTKIWIQIVDFTRPKKKSDLNVFRVKKGIGGKTVPLPKLNGPLPMLSLAWSMMDDTSKSSGMLFTASFNWSSDIPTNKKRIKIN